MVAAYRASVMAGNGSGTSVTSAYPTGTATGDYVMAQLYKENDGAVIPWAAEAEEAQR